MRRLPTLIVVPIIAVSHVARGQTGVLHGTIRDSVTARPVPRVTVCYWSGVPLRTRTRADSTGAFRLDSLAPDSGSIGASCEMLPRGSRQLFNRWFRRLPPDPLGVVVKSQGCDTRLERRMRGIFAGHYSSGFEQSEFIPCPKAGWYIPSDTIDVMDFRRNAWVTWSRGRETPGFPKRLPKPRLALPPYNYPEYYIRFKGTVVGPGSYGHMSVSGFEATIDSLIDIRTPAAGDCERLTR